MKGSPQKAVVLPTTLKQRYLLNQAAHPDCLDDLRDRWLLTYALSIEPHIDMRRLRRALEKLRKRHDILRLRFEPAKQNWQAVIDPPFREVVRHEDLGDLDEAALHQRVRELTNASMSLVGRHLFEVILVTSKRHPDVVIMRLHHAIVDGFGMLVLMEELTKFIIGVPIPRKAVSFAEYLERFQSPLPSQVERIGAFWDKMHQDLPKAPHVGRKAKGLRPNFYALDAIEQRQIDIIATPQSMRRFEEGAAQQGINTSTMIFCAYLEAMCSCYHLDKMVFMTHINRSDPALDTYVGDHTLDVVLPFQPRGPKNFPASCEALRDMMHEVIAHLPSDTARRGTPYEAALIDAGCFVGQFSVYHPRVMSRQDRSVLRKGFNSQYGEKNQFGPYALTQIAANDRRRISFEMQLTLSAITPAKGFSITFDAQAYTDDEVRKITDQMCAFLALEQSEVKIW